MRRVLAVLLAGVVLAGCGLLGGSGLSGRYMVAGTTTYGYEFHGDGTFYSLVGSGDIGRGTYTVEGSRVRICISVLCNDLTLDGDCLIHGDGARYCKD